MKLFSKILLTFTVCLLIDNVNAASCSFKTQLKYPNGSIGCIEDLPIRNTILIGSDRPLIEVVNRSVDYAVVQPKNPECKGGAVASSNYFSSANRTPQSQLNKVALDLCMNQGCDCEVVIAGGAVMVDKEVLLSGYSPNPSVQTINNQVVVDEKKLQEERTKKAQLEKAQDDLTAKLKLDKEKSLAEEKRMQAELVKSSQDKALAEKARVEQEKRQVEEAKLQAQLAKLQAQEKEKSEVIAKLQQDKESKEKALSAQKNEEERIAVLRKELEREIRASLQNEGVGVQTQSTQKSKLEPLIFANRKALVIGNDTYQSVTPLVNAREDAKVVAEALSLLGYKVSLKLDVTQKQFKSELRSFKSQVQPGDEVAIFYAGHGVQIASTNYLLPVDISAQNEEDIKDDGVSLQRLLDDMNEKSAKFTLAMIDACRDNPFKGSGRALSTRGLAPTTAATGQMIVFSAGTGQQALDKLGPNDKSKNGLFTRVFVKEMQKSGVSVDRVVRNVRAEVVALAKSVGHDQVPAIYDQVVGEFYFRQ